MKMDVLLRVHIRKVTLLSIWSVCGSGQTGPSLRVGLERKKFIMHQRDIFSREL